MPFTSIASCWRITGPDGTLYEFAVHDETTLLPPGPPLPNTPPTFDPTAWHLTRMVSPAGGAIEFGYEAERQVPHYTGWSSRRFYVVETADDATCAERPDPTPQHGRAESNVRVLRWITSPSDSVAFHREPYVGGAVPVYDDQATSYRLHRIEVFARATGALKVEFVLDHDEAVLQANRRLFLSSVRTRGLAGDTLPPYVFSYRSPDLLPSFDSKAIDHWGFANYAVNNQDLIPTVTLPDGRVVGGADREPGGYTSDTGLLEEVSLPTGGRLEFEYEPHDYSEIAGAGTPGGTNVQAASHQVRAYNDGSLTTTTDTTLTFTTTSCALTDHNPVSGIVSVGVDPHCPPDEFGQETLQCTDSSGNTVTTTGSASYGEVGEVGASLHSSYHGPVSLACGANYEISAHAPSPGDRVTIGIMYDDIVPASSPAGTPRIAGGARIRQTTFDPGGGAPVVRRYGYRLRQTPTQSSGVLGVEPSYVQESSRDVVGCGFYETRSSPRVALDLVGPHVSYSEVSVSVQGAGGTREAFEDLPGAVYPASSPATFGVLDGQAWKRGLPTATEVFDEQGGLLYETETDHVLVPYPDGSTQHAITGLSVTWVPQLTMDDSYLFYTSRWYDLSTGRVRAATVTERTY